MILHVPLLKVGSDAWMALSFALAAKLPGQRQPDLACAAFTSDRRKCFSMSMFERPVLHVDVVIEALGSMSAVWPRHIASSQASS